MEICPFDSAMAIPIESVLKIMSVFVNIDQYVLTKTGYRLIMKNNSYAAYFSLSDLLNIYLYATL